MVDILVATILYYNYYKDNLTFRPNVVQYVSISRMITGCALDTPITPRSNHQTGGSEPAVNDSGIHTAYSEYYTEFNLDSRCLSITHQQYYCQYFVTDVTPIRNIVSKVQYHNSTTEVVIESEN